ncbi:MAG TPA: DUF167 domain-containing protein [Pyrinomonadaceae bacterium]|nr:DUF167 domain-containing protein [Pyrinomonadaceae bacterium]
MIDFEEGSGALTFAVRVVPRASKSALAGEHGGALKVRVAAPPVEGAANEELARFLAKTFGVAARDVEVLSGRASKSKRVRVRGAKASDLLRLAEGERL